MVGEKSRAQRRQYEVGIDEEGVTCLSAWRYRLHLNEHCSEQGHRKQQGSYWMVLEQVLALAPGREPEPEPLLGVGLEPELLVLALLPELGLVPGFVLELELELASVLVELNQGTNGSSHSVVVAAGRY